MRGLTFRTPSRADIDAITAFHTACWREAYVGVVPQDYLDSDAAEERQRLWAEHMLASDHDLLLAEEDGAIVGVAGWGHGSWLHVTGLELKSLYVSASQRGTGLASDLLHRAIGDAPAFLWIYEGNDRAHRFYERHGFADSGITEPDPRTGLIVSLMQRS